MTTQVISKELKQINQKLDTLLEETKTCEVPKEKHMRKE